MKSTDALVAGEVGKPLRRDGLAHNTLMNRTMKRALATTMRRIAVDRRKAGIAASLIGGVYHAIMRRP
ncbi:hypothetical protein DC429_16420 [Arthrobacter sp. TPD3018]|nr:hypothetical protein DC425_16315 [Sphingomonas sp. TPD3009]PVE52595.1 hypothetical protein DC429_16420 [Arthrobacter sp. TPD3018]PVE80722.1 hypothetical protein DC431_15810 [Sphingomonas melonis]